MPAFLALSGAGSRSHTICEPSGDSPRTPAASSPPTGVPTRSTGMTSLATIVSAKPSWPAFVAVSTVHIAEHQHQGADLDRGYPRGKHGMRRAENFDLE